MEGTLNANTNKNSQSGGQKHESANKYAVKNPDAGINPDPAVDMDIDINAKYGWDPAKPLFCLEKLRVGSVLAKRSVKDESKGETAEFMLKFPIQ